MNRRHLLKAGILALFGMGITPSVTKAVGPRITEFDADDKFLVWYFTENESGELLALESEPVFKNYHFPTNVQYAYSGTVTRYVYVGEVKRQNPKFALSLQENNLDKILHDHLPLPVIRRIG